MIVFEVAIYKIGLIVIDYRDKLAGKSRLKVYIGVCII